MLRDIKIDLWIITADMQTRWKPLVAPIGANSYVGWAALYLASYIYIYMPFVYLVRSSDSQWSLVALEDILIYYNIIYFLHLYVHPVRPEPWYRPYRQLASNINSRRQSLQMTLSFKWFMSGYCKALGFVVS